MQLQSFRPSPPMAVSLLALFIALGTAGYAANTIGSSDIIDEAILSQDLKDGEVRTTELADTAVTLAKLAPNAVGPWNVINNSLTSLDLKGADSLASISLAAGSVPRGSCVNAVAAVAGAQVNEVPLISPRAEPPAGILLFATRVSVANQVRLKVCNFGSGSSPAISNLPVRIMTFG
jgi:hypothetical protein